MGVGCASAGKSKLNTTNETKINQFVQQEELLPQWMCYVTDVNKT